MGAPECKTLKSLTQASVSTEEVIQVEQQEETVVGATYIIGGNHKVYSEYAAVD